MLTQMLLLSESPNTALSEPLDWGNLCLFQNADLLYRILYQGISGIEIVAGAAGLDGEKGSPYSNARKSDLNTATSTGTLQIVPVDEFTFTAKAGGVYFVEYSIRDQIGQISDTVGFGIDVPSDASAVCCIMENWTSATTAIRRFISGVSSLATGYTTGRPQTAALQTFVDLILVAGATDGLVTFNHKATAASASPTRLLTGSSFTVYKIGTV